MTISRTCFGLALKIAILLWIPVQSARTEALPVRIGAWNLEHLGSRTEPQRTNADLNALASKIRELGVSVLAVSEVNGWRALRDLAQRIGPNWDGVLGRSGYIGGKPPKQLGVGFLWDTNRLELVSATDWKSLPRRRDGLHIFHRVPVSACFRAVDGGPDFRLVAVHLKAGFEPSDRTKRLIELAEIKRRLEELKQTPGEDTDIAVVGDFNHGHSSPEHSTLSKSGFATYLSPPNPPHQSFILTNKSTTSSRWQDSRKSARIHFASPGRIPLTTKPHGEQSIPITTPSWQNSTPPPTTTLSPPFPPPKPPSARCLCFNSNRQTKLSYPWGAVLEYWHTKNLNYPPSNTRAVNPHDSRLAKGDFILQLFWPFRPTSRIRADFASITTE